MLQRLKSWSSGMFAATKLPPAELPKGKRGQLSFPGFLKSAKPNESALPKTDRRVASTAPDASRSNGTTKAIIRELSHTNPDISGSVSAFLRTGIPDNYSLVAKNPDGTFNREATSAGQEILSRINLVQNYADGFSGIWTLRTLAESMGRELILEGAASMELVLDKALTPAYFAPVAVSTLQFIPDKSSQFKWLRPTQKVGSDIIDLDVPTFLYVQLDTDLLDATANSPLEPAVQSAFFSIQFQMDLQRVVRRALYPRLDVTIDYEAIKLMVPPEAQFDAEARQTFEDNLVASVQAALNDLEPEEALVHMDFLKPDYLSRGNVSLDRELDVLSNMANSKMATGAKVLPAVLGHGTGTQNVASTEALLFMKNANGMVRMKLNELFSRGFTVALRLLGYDVSAEFAFDCIDLRPDSELEAFKQMKQSRILDQLSLGFITDDEACLMLTGRLTPPGYQAKAGTMFRSSAGQDPANNPYSGTSQGGGQSGGGAVNQNLKPDTPTNTPGKKKADVVVFEQRG